MQDDEVFGLPSGNQTLPLRIDFPSPRHSMEIAGREKVMTENLVYSSKRCLNKRAFLQIQNLKSSNGIGKKTWI
jgi:hypothetical protein